MAIDDDILAAFAFNDSYDDTFALAPALTASGTPTFLDSPLNRAVAFGGFNGSGGSSFAYDTDSRYSVAATERTFTGWFYPTSFSGQPGIMSIWNNPSGGLQYLFWHDGTKYALRLKGTGGTEYDVQHPFVPVLNTWTFFVFQFDPATNDYLLQINDETPVTGTLPENINAPAISWAVGGRNSGASLNGACDAYHVWGRTLDSTDIAFMYNAGAGRELDAVPPMDETGILVDWTGRDYRATDEVDSVLGVLPADFPAANTTQWRARLVNDPDGTPAEVEVTAWSDQTTARFSRTKILRETGGDLPTRMRVEVETRHLHEAELLSALQKLSWDFDIGASDLDDDQNLGVLDENVTSDLFDTPDSGDYEVTLGSGLSTGAVQYRLNGGSWTTLINSGGRIGRILALTAGDDLEFRHTETGPDTDQTIMLVTPPVSTAGAYAILVL